MVKDAQKFVETINCGYVSALGNSNDKIDEQLQKINEQAFELNKAFNNGLISYQQYLISKDKLDAQADEKESKRFSAMLEEKMGKYSTFTSGLTALSGQLSQLVSMNASNQTAAIDNQLQSQLDAINTAYEAEVESINNSIMSQTEKDAALKALDEQKARDEQAAQKKADKEKRKIARDAAKMQKDISMFTTAVEIPTAAFQAYASAQVLPFPASQIVGAAMAAAATALGVAKLKLIAEQPLPALAEGGIIPAIPGGRAVQVAEDGSDEAVVPLNNEKGIDALSKALEKALNKTNQAMNIILQVDGDTLGTWIS